MSIAAVTSRVAELQSLIAAASQPRTTSFAGQLDAATTATASAGTASPDAAGLLSVAGAAPATASPVALAATSGTSALPASVPYGAEITAAARRHGVDPALLAGLIKQESGFDPDATSPAGARGLAQLMPATAAGLGVTDPTDPSQAIEGAARYLGQQLQHFGGDTARALAAYNAGPGAVERYAGVPPYAETQDYVRTVQANAAQYAATSTSTPSTT